LGNKIGKGKGNVAPCSTKHHTMNTLSTR